MLLNLTQFSDLSFLVLRLVIAAIFIYHALPKLKGAKMMSQAMGMPAGMIFMLGGIEFLSSLGMIFGVYIQIAAFLLAMVMVGAIYFKMVKWHVPFGAMNKTGWEFDLILLVASIVLLVSGGGAIGIQ
ncbi:MAG: DoxX family protein [Candidatus Wildermuthbacteria bacterium]|nr:DoxX family protein [Candidatus Wildermuthbacteria bacterium]